MNKQRRKQLQEQLDKLEEIKGELESLVEQLEEVKSEIEAVKDEEEMAYDNLPEAFQEGDKGNLMQTAIGLMEDAYDNVDSIVGDLGGVENYFTDAVDRLHEAISC